MSFKDRARNFLRKPDASELPPAQDVQYADPTLGEQSGQESDYLSVAGEASSPANYFHRLGDLPTRAYLQATDFLERAVSDRRNIAMTAGATALLVGGLTAADKYLGHDLSSFFAPVSSVAPVPTGSHQAGQGIITANSLG